MEVRIGVTYSGREIDVDLSTDTDRDELKAKIDSSLADDTSVLWLTDTHGRDVAVPSAKIAYVEIGSADSDRRIGFSA